MCWVQGKVPAASDADEGWRREVERLGAKLCASWPRLPGLGDVNFLG